MAQRRALPWLLALGLLSCGARPGPTWLTGDCFEDHTEAIRRLDALAQRHRTPCTAAADCARVEARVSCQGAGLHALSKASLDAWEADRAAFEASVCPWLSSACSLSTNGALGVISCEDGTCVLTP